MDIEMGTTPVNELYRKKGELQKQMCEIDNQIRTMIKNEYQGKLQTAMQLLGEIYDNIPTSKDGYIETYCNRCEDVVTIDLDDALDKIE